MTALHPDPLLTPQELQARLGAPDLRVLDATWRAPPASDDPRAAYAAERLPGAIFFDIEELSDRDDPLPHMLPRVEKFSSRMRKAGIGDGAEIVAYDDGIFAAARAWWMFRVMGKAEAFVLDGGFPAWRAHGGEIEDGPPLPRAERHFTARRRADLVRTYEEMLRIAANASAQILDARSPGRFSGEEAEPRPGLRAGHIPGSINVHYATLFSHDGRMQGREALIALFADRGVDLKRPIVTTCGSGVSACTLALALARVGRWDVAVYDGSWAEWGGKAEAPIATGPG